MASTDFEREKTEFRDYYGTHLKLMEDAKDSYIALLTALVIRSKGVEISKIEGRVKDREECIRKFNLKYRTDLEKGGNGYAIKDHISDLIGIRIVCLYEDDIERIREVIEHHFSVIDVTDKIAAIESTESNFGYKGLHLDVKLGPPRSTAEEYQVYADLAFEIQVRTIVQDSWSVLDHKIKYKKAIPNNLKRRINTLAALFELADREFKEIREATLHEIQMAEEDEPEQRDPAQSQQTPRPSNTRLQLNAFGLLRIAKHFFRAFEFEPHKVDGFTADIVKMCPNITRRDLNSFVGENITAVRRYQAEFERDNPDDSLNPYTIIRHCLYKQDRVAFHDALTNVARERFDAWLAREG
ncbi:GTP pyrophosphokinase [Noviherbaspirillum pedocola]|uniref:(P)ppGpp synthetase n=1 Tax=Noviherbaspirillum pedocola TaxID=2801341 RepID=A0A934STY2_9BURK|nr:(p)ppGpp synthetase [Noviherbaspirillum pedocola]MBK4735484.1 (p)ppGpp synthetase [Noviherbaspirillum pedocola]